MTDEKILKIVQRLEEIIDRSVTILRPNNRQSNLWNSIEDSDPQFPDKLDLIERAIELIRINKRCLENKLQFSHFIQGKLEIEEGCLRYTHPDRIRLVDSGTPSIHLQPKLLIFLLFRHDKAGEKVYDIITRFVRTIWSDLKILDFVKTKTGVMRCFTNTRFAANTLREYGLLKFTKKEAYKTWLLSLTGMMVASNFLMDDTWKKPIAIQSYGTDLHPDIKAAFKALTNYDEFLKKLTFITKPKTNLAKNFTDGSNRTYRLLSDYHKILEDNDLSKLKKKEKCQAILQELENDQTVIDFFNELVINLKAGDLLTAK